MRTEKINVAVDKSYVRIRIEKKAIVEKAYFIMRLGHVTVDKPYVRLRKPSTGHSL